MATHSSTLARRIPGTQESGGLQSMESQRVRRDYVTFTSLHQTLCINSQIRVTHFHCTSSNGKSFKRESREFCQWAHCELMFQSCYSWRCSHSSIFSLIPTVPNLLNSSQVCSPFLRKESFPPQQDKSHREIFLKFPLNFHLSPSPFLLS